MTDTNVTRARRKQEQEENIEAFHEVFGNPLAPEPTTGRYHMLLHRGAIAATRNNFDEGRSTSNPAKPSVVDYLIDVDKCVTVALLGDVAAENLFYSVFIDGMEDASVIDKDVYEELLQQVGAVLLELEVSPATTYFNTFRQSARSYKEQYRNGDDTSSSDSDSSDNTDQGPVHELQPQHERTAYV